jgi:hypothetical protein
MAKTLKRADVARLRRKMKKLYPEAQFLLADYGFSLSVRNAAGSYGSRLTYAFREERDGCLGWLIVSKDRLAEIAVLLAEEQAKSDKPNEMKVTVELGKADEAPADQEGSSQ